MTNHVEQAKDPADSHATQTRQSAQLLSRRQVAQRWACCEHTVARRRDLKPVRFNKRLLRYRLADVEAIEAAAIA